MLIWQRSIDFHFTQAQRTSLAFAALPILLGPLPTSEGLNILYTDIAAESYESATANLCAESRSDLYRCQRRRILYTVMATLAILALMQPSSWNLSQSGNLLVTLTRKASCQHPSGLKTELNLICMTSAPHIYFGTNSYQGCRQASLSGAGASNFCRLKYVLMRMRSPFLLRSAPSTTSALST